MSKKISPSKRRHVVTLLREKQEIKLREKQEIKANSGRAYRSLRTTGAKPRETKAN